MNARSVGLRQKLGSTVLVGLICLVACQRESHVQITTRTTLRGEQAATNQALELQVGQAMGIHVDAVKKRAIKPKWKVSATSSNTSVVSIGRADDKNVFVVAGVAEGTAEIEFSFRNRRVQIPVTVLPREDWEPTAEEFAFGGAGGWGGYGGSL